MKPILYYDDISPVVRSVLMLIDELKIDVELKFLDLFKGEHRSSEFFKISPNRTVPALQHNNYVITDSHAILIYLVEEFGGPSSLLYSSDKMIRIKTLDMLFFNGTNLFRKDSDLMTEIIAGTLNDMTRHSIKIVDCYESLEAFLANSRFLTGNSMSIADISIVATLSTIHLVLPVDGARFPLLTEWFEKMRKRSFYLTGNVPGLQKLKEILRDRSDLPIGLAE